VFDLAQEQQVMLDDLFTSTEDALAVISPIVQADLTAQMDEDLADPQWIEDGTGTNPDNYQNFVLTEDSLIFFFPPFQVAPYAAGAFEVTIPLADISSVLAPEYQPAG
jgi:hypothetical protein